MQWDAELRNAGFTGADLVLHDGETEQDSLMSMMISSAVPHAKMANGRLQEPGPHEKFLVVSGITEYVSSAHVAGVTKALNEASRSGEVLHTSLDAVSRFDDLQDITAVVIQDDSWPSLACLSPPQYATFHAICTQSRSVLWLSDQSEHTDRVNDIGPIEGLFRTLRMEKQESIFATAVVDSSRGAVLEANLQSILVNFLRGLSAHRFEPELVQVEDLLVIPRVKESAKLSSKVHTLTAESVQREQRFGEQNLKLRIRQPGLLDSLYFEHIAPEDETNDLKDLEPHEVEIEVKAVGINFKDCLVALGRVDEDTLGTECAGIVLRAGSKCQHQVGDRVLVNKLDAFRGRLRCHGKLAAKIPHALSFVEAGASVTNFVTAYHSLIRLADIQPGETVLVHSGAGGTGQAAIQVAQLRGATVYTTVNSSRKSDLLQTLYGIPSEHVFNSRNLEFSQGIRRLTKGKGVDVVLNSLAGDALVASWECIAPYGRFIEIGKRDIFSHNTLPMYQFARNVSFSAVDIGAMTKERPELIGDILKHVTDLFNQGKLRTPSPMKVFPVTDVESAFRYLQSGTNAGRVVVEIGSEEMVPVSIDSL
jgi:NADPH:quinone reductase-like Zn-dependent oxidoreductase